ncbi:MAG: hypothetical protein KAV18_07375 [Candidatus Omnitrophica bacterium]|nr:hypothetical protein [Candidatus Omnitrophota bacterium]
MKGFVCEVCGYIAINGSAPENCPVCGAPKSSFSEDEAAIKTAQDAGNMTELEKKHTPVLTVVKECGLIPEGCQDVHAKIGAIKHPMLPEHSIMNIDFYIDKEFIARVKLTPAKLNPAAALHLSAAVGKLSVIAHCNMHGSWIGEADL